MSDRSWVCITLPIKDEAKLLDAMGFSMTEKESLDPEEKDGLLTVTFHEMDYAGNDQLKDMARKRVTFMAQCGPGSNECGKPGIPRHMSAFMFDTDQGAWRSAYLKIRAMLRNAERGGEGRTPPGRLTLPLSATLNLVSDASASPSRFASHAVTICAVIGQGILGLPHLGEALSVGHNGSFAEVPSMAVEPACPIGRNLKPNARTMKDIRRYWRLRKKVEAEFEKVRKASRKQTALDRHLEKSDVPQE